MLSLDWLKKHKYLIVLASLGLIFLMVYFWLFVNIEPKFTSPDETANYYFIKLFAQDSRLSFYEPLNEIADGMIRPRSMGFVDGNTVPGSFLGLILIYGILAKIFGAGIILYFTPFFAVIGVLFFYLLIKEIFSKNIAFISSLLLFILPPFWHYSARGMFHNILFLSMLIIGMYFLVRVLNREPGTKNQLLYYLLAGFFIGLALITRTSEIIWVCVILIILFIINRSKISWRNILMFMGPVIILFLVIFYFNNQLYGSPFLFAYSGSGESVEAVSGESITHTLFFKFKQLVLPFGIDFDRIGSSFYQYVIVVFPWFSILFFVGLIWLLKNNFLNIIKKLFSNVNISYKQFQAKQKIYLWLYVLTVVWLVIYYGSYEFYEYIDRTKTILGSSYLRYWLPLYVFGLPFCTLALMEIKKIYKNRKISNLVVLLIIILFYLFSVNKVLLDPLHGLSQIKMYNSQNIQKERVIAQQTEPDSVIISGYADKVFFPNRKVVVKLPDDNDRFKEIVTNLTDRVSVYYFYSPLDENGEKVLTMFKKHDFEFELRLVHEFLQDREILYEVRKYQP